MSVITLTDRVSVSVRAKNETQGNSQKRDTGKNIANALGNGNISDSLADQIGATNKPTITDENGNEWVSMADIIAAGKAMNAAGAFDEKEVHEGIRIYNVEKYGVGPAEFSYIAEDAEAYGWYGYIEIPEGVYYVVRGNKDPITMISVVAFSKEAFTFTNKTKQKSGGDWTYTYNNGTARSQGVDGIEYSFFKNAPSFQVRGSYTAPIHIVGPEVPEPTDRDIAGFLFGPTHKSGGSLVDWTKPDDEIEEDIRRLHETWDVTEHEGAVTANGTYVMAGPIEFNPGD